MTLFFSVSIEAGVFSHITTGNCSVANYVDSIDAEGRNLPRGSKTFILNLRDVGPQYKVRASCWVLFIFCAHTIILTGLNDDAPDDKHLKLIYCCLFGLAVLFCSSVFVNQFK